MIMLRSSVLVSLALVGAAAIAADAPAPTAQLSARNDARVTSPSERPKADAKADATAKELSGMSILGNQEAPKALVIVPWKSSQLGDRLGISKTLDDGRQPVDKDVFMRQLSYYEIRANSK
jgi:hypothetical protein